MSQFLICLGIPTLAWGIYITGWYGGVMYARTGDNKRVSVFGTAAIVAGATATIFGALIV